MSCRLPRRPGPRAAYEHGAALTADPDLPFERTLLDLAHGTGLKWIFPGLGSGGVGVADLLVAASGVAAAGEYEAAREQVGFGDNWGYWLQPSDAWAGCQLPTTRDKAAVSPGARGHIPELDCVHLVTQGGSVLVSNAAILDYSDLRPYKSDLKKFSDFPVYPGLEKTLASRKREHQPDDVVRHVMAVCSGYSYGGIDSTLHDPRALDGINALSAMMVRLGLPENRCRIISETIDAMLVCSTTYIVQSKNRDVVIVVYRGTEPTNILSWLVDIDVHAQDQVVLELGGSGYEAHAGFYRNVRATRFEVLRTLQYAMARRPLEEVDKFRQRTAAPPRLAPGEKSPALYITGHSLGGAMAVILAMMLMMDSEYREDLGAAIRGVYTFGQPMVGSRRLATGYKLLDPRYRAPVIRYVYQRDPIPHMPSRDIGKFVHLGDEYRYDDTDGTWPKREPSKQMGSVFGMGEALLAFPLGQLPFLGGIFPYTIADHLPASYINTLSAGRSEYGDDLVRLRPRAPRLPIPIPVPAPRLAHIPRLAPYVARPLAPIPLPFLGLNGRSRLDPVRTMANLLRI